MHVAICDTERGNCHPAPFSALTQQFEPIREGVSGLANTKLYNPKQRRRSFLAIFVLECRRHMQPSPVRAPGRGRFKWSWQDLLFDEVNVLDLVMICYHPLKVLSGVRSPVNLLAISKQRDNQPQRAETRQGMNMGIWVAYGETHKFVTYMSTRSGVIYSAVVFSTSISTICPS